MRPLPIYSPQAKRLLEMVLHKIDRAASDLPGQRAEETMAAWRAVFLEALEELFLWHAHAIEDEVISVTTLHVRVAHRFTAMTAWRAPVPVKRELPDSTMGQEFIRWLYDRGQVGNDTPRDPDPPGGGHPSP